MHQLLERIPDLSGELVEEDDGVEDRAVGLLDGSRDRIEREIASGVGRKTQRHLRARLVPDGPPLARERVLPELPGRCPVSVEELAVLRRDARIIEDEGVVRLDVEAPEGEVR